METTDELFLALAVMAVRPLSGQVGLDNQPLAMTATCWQVVLHVSPDTTRGVPSLPPMPVPTSRHDVQVIAGRRRWPRRRGQCRRRHGFHLCL